MPERVDVNPELLVWARERSGLPAHDLAVRFPMLAQWEHGARLNPREFRGFALADKLAPLAFVNGADTKAAQIFTLVHELVHLWLGEAALDDADLAVTSAGNVERWCNQVAAEVLVPLALLPRVPSQALTTAVLDQLARQFKVSTLVVLRRLYEGERLGHDEYQALFSTEYQRIMGIIGNRASGGDFFATQPVRVSRRFARAVVASTLEGQTLYRDAFQLLGFRKQSTFNELATRLGIG
jgi:IrrE N-terminal-like domain